LRDRSTLPHARLRAAIFWILFLLWPSQRVVCHIWQPRWISHAADIGAAITALAFLLGKFLFQDTQKELSQRTSQLETLLGQVRDGLASVGVTRREPGLKLIRRDDDDQGVSG